MHTCIHSSSSSSSSSSASEEAEESEEEGGRGQMQMGQAGGREGAGDKDKKEEGGKVVCEVLHVPATRPVSH
jgi:hypothetical protein